jgi:hypothetical protein
MQDNPAIKAKVAAYLLLNKEIADRKTMQENLKKELDPYLLEAETNSRGSHVIAFSEPLEVNGKRYASLQKQRKTSKVLNEERALELLNEKADEGQWEDERYLEPIILVQHVDHDALWDLFSRDLITEAEWDSLFDVTVTYAFAPTKE